MKRWTHRESSSSAAQHASKNQKTSAEQPVAGTMASTTYETQYVPKEQRELPMMAVDEVNYNPSRPIPSEQSAWEWFMKYDNSLSSFCVS
jgi:hypothetical protein